MEVVCSLFRVFVFIDCCYVSTFGTDFFIVKAGLAAVPTAEPKVAVYSVRTVENCQLSAAFVYDLSEVSTRHFVISISLTSGCRSDEFLFYVSDDFCFS